MKSQKKKSSTTKKNPFKENGMFAGAHPLVFQLAKDLRRNMTHAEKILWMHLKEGVHGLKFRRQHPIGIYVADFYCHKIKLIIEADGNIHEIGNNPACDKEREKSLNEKGYKMIRFKNYQIEKDLKTVLDQISSTTEIELRKLNKE